MRSNRFRQPAARRAKNRRMLIESLEKRQLLTAGFQNPIDRLDVNDDELITPIDVLLVINDLNSYRSGVLSERQDSIVGLIDVNGDGLSSPIDALLVINRLNAGGGGLRTPREGEFFSTEQLIKVDLAPSDGASIYRLDIDANFGSTTVSSMLPDLIAVYVVDHADPSKTLLDRGESGTSVFSLSPTKTEIAAGIARWDGKTLELDLSSIADKGVADIKIQRLNGDLTRESSFVVGSVEASIDMERTPGQLLSLRSAPVASAGSLDLASMTVSDTVQPLIENIRFDSQTGQYLAEVSIRNLGDAIGRDVALVLPKFPEHVTLENASGFDADGAPYLNLRSAIAAGGLGKNESSNRVELRINNPELKLVNLRPYVMVGAANAAPQLAVIPTQTVMPGSHLELQLTASDADADKLSYSITGSPQLPNNTQFTDGRIKFTPTPDQIGTYIVTSRATDGVLTDVKQFTLNVVADPLTTTRVSGRVLDIDGTPISGIRVEVGAVQGLTNTNGDFLLNLGSSAPATDTLRVRGDLLNISGVTYPFIAEKLPLLLDRPVFAHFNNTINRPIYLPKLDMANSKAIDPTVSRYVRTSAIPDLRLLVTAGTLVNQQGAPFAGQLSITEVPISLTPAALPDNLLPDMVVTIQPGDMTFTRPAPIDFPNRLNFAPGVMFDLWSINPSTGEFEDVGDMKVSEDGNTIQTVSGGVRTSSWHFPVPQIAQKPKNETKPPECSCEELLPFQSEVGAYSGTHLVEYQLGTYESLGENRSVTLAYDSQRTYSQSTIQFSFDVIAESPAIFADPNFASVDQLAASVTLSKGTTRQQFSTNSPDNASSRNGLSLFSIGEIAFGKSVGAGIAIDTSNLKTGVYDYDLSTGVVLSSASSLSGSLTKLSGSLVNINSSNSPFGSGWGIAGLQQIVEVEDGSALLVDGGGSELLFRKASPNSAVQYVSPASDFSHLTKTSTGSFVRTLSDGTIFTFTSNGLLSSVRERNSRETNYRYNSAGLLEAITDPSGQAISFAYKNGHISSIASPNGMTTKLSVDAQGDLVKVDEPDGSSNTWEYDSRHLLTSETDSQGSKTQTVYDDLGKVSRGISANGVEIVISPSSVRGIASNYTSTNSASLIPAADTDFKREFLATQANGNIQRRQLTVFGKTEVESDSAGLIIRYEFNENEKISKSIDGRGNETAFSYDANGNLMSVVDSARNEPKLSSSVFSPLDSFHFPGRMYRAASNPTGFASADMNGDGHLDLITTNASTYEQAHGVSVLLSNGVGGFQTANDYYNTNEYPFGIVADDFNNDSLIDIVVLDRRVHELTVLPGDGKGNLLYPYTFTLPSKALQLFSGDFDADGHTDIVTVNDDMSLTVLLNGHFDAPFQFQLPNPIESVAVSDIDQDGSDDFVVVFKDSSEIGFIVSDGKGGFSIQSSLDVGRVPYQIYSADFDQNGIADFVLSYLANENIPTDSIDIFLGKGGGKYEFKTTFEVGSVFGSLLVSDLSGDGIPDILTGRTSFISTGRGGFIRGPQVGTQGLEVLSIAMDVNADSYPDLVSVEAPGFISVRRGNGSGVFESSESFSVVPAGANPVASYSPVSISHADLNQDGFDDVIAANEGGAQQLGSISVFLGNGLGGLGPAQEFVGNGDVAFVFDINGDGFLDIVTDGTVYIGDGAGGFAEQHTFATGQSISKFFNTYSGAIGDLNNDGIVDLVFNSPNDAKISIVYGTGTDTFFKSPVKLDLGISVGGIAEPSGITIADLDEDGFQDLVLNGARVKAVFGDAKGEFKRSWYLSPGGYVNGAPGVADVDLDGHLDLILYFNPYNTPGIEIYRGTGTGEFNPASFLPLPDSRLKYTSIKTQDLNGDGKIDLAIQSYPSGAIGVAEGNGDGSFQPFEFYDASIPSRGTFDFADLDVDGRPDIISVGWSGNSISVLLQSERSFASGQQIRVTTEYDAVTGTPIAVRDGNGNVTLQTVDSTTGNVITRKLPNGTEYAYTYTKLGLVDTITDPKGTVTDYDYNSAGQISKITESKGTADERAIQYGYDATGNKTFEIDPNGNRTEYKYDIANRLILVLDANGQRTEFTRDSVGNITQVKDATGRISRNAFDPQGRLTYSIDSLGQRTQFEYDLSGNLLTETDPLGKITQYKYDVRNRRTSSTSPDGEKTSYRYDQDDNLVALIDPLGNQTRFLYDARNRLVREIDPLGKSIEYGYDNADNLTRETDRRGFITQWQYDSLNRQTSETWKSPSGDVVETFNDSYDAVGNLTNANSIASKLTFIYDTLSRVSTVENAGTLNSPNVVLAYTYDGVGNVLTVSETIDGVAGAVTTYSYDTLNRTKSISQSGSTVSEKAVDFVYNQIGQFSEISRYSDVNHGSLVARSKFDYDSVNRLQSLTHGSATDARSLAFYDFEYDAASRITAITDIDGRTDYGYDDTNQLTEADRAAGDSRGDERYAYDANGNRVSSSLHESGYVTGPGNRLLSDGSYNYGYDAEGNMILRTNIATGDFREFKYDHRNRLVLVTDSLKSEVVTQEVAFQYDALNRRILKQVSTYADRTTVGTTQFYVYDRDNVILEFEGTEVFDDGRLTNASQALALKIRNLFGPAVDQILAQDILNESRTQWLLTDHLGSVRDVVSGNGVVENHVVYDSFGAVSSQTSSVVVTRYGFTGRERDAEISLTFYRGRYYDSSIGAFSSEDPIRFDSGDANLFRYVLNQPVYFTDPFGFAPWVGNYAGPGNNGYDKPPLFEGDAGAREHDLAYERLGTEGVKGALTDIDTAYADLNLALKALQSIVPDALVGGHLGYALTDAAIAALFGLIGGYKLTPKLLKDLLDQLDEIARKYNNNKPGSPGQCMIGGVPPDQYIGPAYY